MILHLCAPNWSDNKNTTLDVFAAHPQSHTAPKGMDAATMDPERPRCALYLQSPPGLNVTIEASMFLIGI